MSGIGSSAPLVRELRERLLELGCRVRRGQASSSHEVWETPGGRMLTLVVHHRNRAVSLAVLKTVRRALRAEGIRL